MAAAFSVVSDFGQAAHIDYDNFYFFTPATRVAIFGPDRPVVPPTPRATQLPRIKEQPCPCTRHA